MLYTWNLKNIVNQLYIKKNKREKIATTPWEMWGNERKVHGNKKSLIPVPILLLILWIEQLTQLPRSQLGSLLCSYTSQQCDD